MSDDRLRDRVTPRMLRRIEFCERHVTDKGNNHWKLEGHEWVVEELWRPLDGYKTWPKDSDKLCDACALASNKLVDIPEIDLCTQPDCEGLETHKIVAVVEALERRGGKTFNAAAYCHSEIYQENDARIGYLCSVLTQREDIVLDNFTGVVERDSELSKRGKTRLAGITVPARRSRLGWLSHSKAEGVGRGLGLLVIDEARDIKAEVAARIIPTAFEEVGHQCPRGCWKAKETKRKTCPVCRARLTERKGRILIMSSKGKLYGKPDADWFAHLVEHLREHPDPQWHLYENDEGRVLNPDVETSGVKDAVSRVLGRVEGIRDHIDAEIRNVFIEPGDDFVSRAEWEAALDPELTNLEGCVAPAIGFLDTARSGDLINLVIVAQDLAEEVADQKISIEPWRRLFVPRIDMWDPKDLTQHGVIDETYMLDYLDVLLPCYMGLTDLLVDLRGGMVWASRLISRAKTKSWGRRLTPFKGSGDRERDIGWQAFFEMLTPEPRIRMPDIPRIRQEFEAIEWNVRKDGTRTVVDKARHVRHKEVTESIALALWRIQHEIVKSANRPSLAKANQGKGRYQQKENILGAVFKPKPQTRQSIGGYRFDRMI